LDIAIGIRVLDIEKSERGIIRAVESYRRTRIMRKDAVREKADIFNILDKTAEYEMN
jgi:hypothetical protein